MATAPTWMTKTHKPAAEPAPKPKETRYFLCTGQCVRYSELYKYPESHIIGHLTYVVDENTRVTGLARWETSQRCDTVPSLSLVKIDCILIGDARAIRCRYPSCARLQRWEIGKAAYMALMSRYAKDNHEPI